MSFYNFPFYRQQKYTFLEDTEIQRDSELSMEHANRQKKYFKGKILGTVLDNISLKYR